VGANRGSWESRGWRGKFVEKRNAGGGKKTSSQPGLGRASRKRAIGSCSENTVKHLIKREERETRVGKKNKPSQGDGLTGAPTVKENIKRGEGPGWGGKGAFRAQKSNRKE